MNREILFDSLKYSLRDLTLEEFAGLFINKGLAIEEFYKLCNDINAGKNISLLFNPHRLNTSTVVNKYSVYTALQVDRLLSGLARIYIYNLEHGINDALFNAIQRGFQNVQYVNEFPPYVARQIYKTYGNSDKLKVLDPCAGWGGRMIGCASIPNTTYIGCEPCTETFKGLSNLGLWLTKLQPSFKFNLHKLPYEDTELPDDFDLALTSPPYFDVEHYSDEDTNSFNRYKDFESWVNGFYEPLIVNTVNRLKPDGVFILNIGDRKYNLSDELIKICNKHDLCCNRINDYLSGNGPTKEKFYVISKHSVVARSKKLF